MTAGGAAIYSDEVKKGCSVGKLFRLISSPAPFSRQGGRCVLAFLPLLTTSTSTDLFSHLAVNKEDNQSRDEQPRPLTNDAAHLAAPSSRESHDSPYPKTFWMIGHHCLSAWPMSLAQFLPMGGYGDVWDEPRRQQPRLGRQMSSSATVVE